MLKSPATVSAKSARSESDLLFPFFQCTKSKVLFVLTDWSFLKIPRSGRFLGCVRKEGLQQAGLGPWGGNPGSLRTGLGPWGGKEGGPRRRALTPG
jgi:hypothetical protein